MNNQTEFSIGEAVNYSWRKVTSNLLFFILLLLITSVAPSVVSSLGSFLGERFALFSMIFSLAAIAVSLILSVGQIKILLKVIDGTEYKLEELFSYASLVPKYFLGSLLYGLLVFFGFLFFIFPGIYLAMKYQYVPYLLIDQNTDISTAFSKSGEMTKGHKLHLWFFGIVLGLVNVAGFFALLIGLFVTIPVTYLAQAYVYRKLMK